MKHVIQFRDGQNAESELPELSDVFSRRPEKQSIDFQTAFHYLLNIDEFPEMLPLAFQIARTSVSKPPHKHSVFNNEFTDKKLCTNSFKELTSRLNHHANSKNINNDTFINTLEKNKLFAAKAAPTFLASNALLQNFSKAATAHTLVGSELNKIFALQNSSYIKKIKSHEHDIDFLEIPSLIHFHQSKVTQQLIKDKSLSKDDFELALILLSFREFPREFLPEILGINFARHALGAHALIEKNSLQNFISFELSEDILQNLKQRKELLTSLSLKTINLFCEQIPVNIKFDIKKRILNGINIYTSAWEHWFCNIEQYCSTQSNSFNREMNALIKSKSACALGYHRSKRLGSHKIDELLNEENFDTEQVLKYLADSSHIVAGNADASPFTNELIHLGGPMAGVFNEDEIIIIRNWVNNLNKQKSVETHSNKSKKKSKDSKENYHYSFWGKESYLLECKKEYGNRPCSVRELYYKLVNIEYFPDVLPIAESYLISRLNRTKSSLSNGERPIPSPHYSHEVLENWVANKHREQINAYQPLKGKPRVSKEVFISSIVNLAPLLLIDGCWLQGASAPQTLHTPIGKKLYQIFFEEIGEGKVELHHANIYRVLLESMNVQLSEVNELDFSFSELFPENSFEVPILWLTLSSFTRHYFPELLGINLAVELAGIGSGYMEAHDTLKFFGFPTTFVDYHNSSDNASVGHAAIAVNIIKLFMDDIAAHEGHHRLDYYWHRIWTGMRLTLPSSSDFYWNPRENTEYRNHDIYNQHSSVFKY